MVVSSCKFSSNLVFKSHPIVIRTDDITFLATWDDDSNVGVTNLTKAELKELTTSTGSDNGEHHDITSMLKKHRSHSYLASVELLEVRQEILMETDDPVFKLKLRFDICCMALEERKVPEIEDPSLLCHKSMCHISA